jgi:hypothetical protein
MMRQSYDYPQAMPTFILSSDLLIVNMVERYLRYRTPSTPQTVIASPQLPKSDRTPSTPQTAIAPLQLPKQRSHPLTLPNSDRTPSTSQIAIALPQLPNILF